MSTIDTIPFRFRPVRVAGVDYESAAAVPFGVWLRLLAVMIAAKLEKRRTRIHLSRLDPKGLEDVGLTPDQADREIRKSLPFFERR